jgi:gamma-glutamylaminecyclotransferase
VTTTRIFVYGSLLSGEANHGVLSSARCVGEARTSLGFRIHDLGSYPAMAIGGDRDVVGEVYEVSGDTLASLDRFEGHPDFYRRTSIILADRAHAEAYLLPQAEAVLHPIIQSGNWRVHLKGVP